MACNCILCIHQYNHSVEELERFCGWEMLLCLNKMNVKHHRRPKVCLLKGFQGNTPRKILKVTLKSVHFKEILIGFSLLLFFSRRLLRGFRGCYPWKFFFNFIRFKKYLNRFFFFTIAFIPLFIQEPVPYFYAHMLQPT